jgi:hypothetical protein
MDDLGFGILDIMPNDIQSPPEFTEPASVEAMAALAIAPADLVCPDFGASPLEVTIELERRRIEAIQAIIAERSRILARPPIERPRSVTKIPRPSGRRRLKPRSPRPQRRNDAALPLEIEQKDILIRERARERLELAMQEQKLIERRRERRRDEFRRRQLQEERRIQRLREIKQQEYERERQKRHAAFLRVTRSENPRRRKTIRGLFDDAEPDWPVTEPQAPPPRRLRQRKLLVTPTGSE